MSNSSDQQADEAGICEDCGKPILAGELAFFGSEMALCIDHAPMLSSCVEATRRMVEEGDEEEICCCGYDSAEEATEQADRWSAEIAAQGDRKYVVRA